jgi:clan AA aspartic protease
VTPYAPIKVIGVRQSVEVTALVDTGFDGDVCLPIRLAVPLGLELIASQWVELADGSRQDKLLFAGRVEFFDQERDVQIFLIDSEDALVGTRLLNHYQASIEFPGGQVKVAADRRRRRKSKRR